MKRISPGGTVTIIVLVAVLVLLAVVSTIVSNKPHNTQLSGVASPSLAETGATPSESASTPDSSNSSSSAATSASSSASSASRSAARATSSSLAKPAKSRPAAGSSNGGEAAGNSPNEKVLRNTYVTGYTWFDNTPPGSSTISNPVLHQKAGGTGTYQDPITVAVGHVIENGKDTLDYPAGTRFYLPYLRRYFIVEDSCGDGPTPQNGPCHSVDKADAGAQRWIDIWIDGQSGDHGSVQACAGKITANHTVIQNPSPDYAVVRGSVFTGGSCSQQYSDTPVRS